MRDDLHDQGHQRCLRACTQRNVLCIVTHWYMLDPENEPKEERGHMQGTRILMQVES